VRAVEGDDRGGRKKEEEQLMGRISRSFQLVGQSYQILWRDKELMVLPLISGIFIVAVASVIVLGYDFGAAAGPGPTLYVPLFFLYVVMYTIGIFFQAAVIAGATERMRGGDPTVASALAAAWTRLGPIVMWAVVAATVGMLLRAVQDRVGFVGKIVVGLAGAAWSLATFFIVPVLVLEDKSIGDSFTQSVAVFKKTWGETMAGGVSLGGAAFCAWLALFGIVALLAAVVGPAAIVLLVAGAIVLGVFFSTLQGIYVASLYRYATEGLVPPGFDRTLLDNAFVPKSR
jgi:uncharacterized protein DUF6159